MCANCQKQFVNVVMRENSFEKQLKMFQLHYMEQLCGMLRVLLIVVCTGQLNLLYTSSRRRKARRQRFSRTD